MQKTTARKPFFFSVMVAQINQVIAEKLRTEVDLDKNEF